MNVMYLRDNKLVLMLVNIISIGLLFMIFDLIFRFLKFSLIYHKLYFYWDIYSTFYSLISLVFCSLWLCTSFRFSMKLWSKKIPQRIP